MAIIKKDNNKRIVIDLTGPQGNAFWLIGYARKIGHQMGLDTDKITKEMTSGDYENLIQVFDNYFGSVVDLER